MLKTKIISGLVFLLAGFSVMAPVFAQKPPLQTIIIDPGHGGIDPGAEGTYSTEAQCALEISLKLRDQLKNTFPEIKVLMTREKDELPGGSKSKDAALRYRANFAYPY